MVSILIPAYNAGDWVEGTLRSALAQTWPRKEIVLVDDGSKDQTLAIAKRFESDAVRVFSQPNQGAAAARNKAFSLSKGDYIQWLDADDLLAPDKIQKQMLALGETADRRVLLSGEWAHFLFAPDRAKFIPSPLWSSLSPVEWLTRKMEHDVHMQTSTWLVSREIAEAAGPWNTQLLGDDDGEYFCRILSQSKAVRFVPGAKMFYRMTGGFSLSQIGSSQRKIDAQVESCRLHVKYLLALETSDRTRAACVKYLEKYAGLFHPEHPGAVTQLEKIACGIGGAIRIPRLPWKYEWLAKLVGRHRAKRARYHYNEIKWSAIRLYDRAVCPREKRGD